MSNLTPQNNENDSWENCRGGELQSLGKSLRTAERTRMAGQVMKRSLLAATAGILLAFSLSSLTDNLNPRSDGITCEACHARFAAYEQHLTNVYPMAKQEASDMATHLTECSYCQQLFEKDYPGLLSAAGISVAGVFSLVCLFRHTS